MWQTAQFTAGDQDPIVPHGDLAYALHFHFIQQRETVQVEFQELRIIRNVDVLIVHEHVRSEAASFNGDRGGIRLVRRIVTAESNWYDLLLVLPVENAFNEHQHLVHVGLRSCEERDRKTEL